MNWKKDLWITYLYSTLLFGLLSQARFVYQTATGKTIDLAIVNAAEGWTADSGREVIDISTLPANGKKHMLEYYQMETELGVERKRK